MKTTLAIALAAYAIFSVEAFGSHKKAIKAGAAIAAIGAGALSQVAPAVVAAGLWAPPAHYGGHHHHEDHHGHESHGHATYSHHGGHHGGHGGGLGLGKGVSIGHGHGHGYNEFGWASLPAPVVNIGPILRHVALPPIHELLPRLNVALPRFHHGGHGHGW